MIGTGRIFGGLALAGVLAVGGSGVAVATETGAGAGAILEARCVSCHATQPDGTMTRISHARKTPEGWLMTIFRMNQVHGAGTTPDESRALVRWLADRQGLAPEEAAPFRYILERQPAVVEAPVEEGDLSTMCARCHSFARIGLQRRNEDEWRKLAHFHLGQWPTTEYQALGRDRKWWEIASTETPALLGRMFPMETPDWTAWKDAPKPDLAGTWVVRPSSGTYGGTATITPDTNGEGYAVTYDLVDAAGAKLPGNGKAIVYTGYEWRGTSTLGGKAVREVLAASKDGMRLEGRWFLEKHDEIGASFQARKVEPGAAVIAGLSREHLQQGETARITILGSGLEGDVDLGPGVTATVVSRSPNAVVVEARAEASAAVGPRPVKVGSATADGPVMYSALDSVRVEPAYAIARVGGNDGPLPPVTAQFEAVGYLNGPDGTAGTDDDVRVGVMPARWLVEPFNEPAAAMEDVKFAGSIDETGLFTPAGAGPNPERVFSTNNVGDLKIIATVGTGNAALKADGRLITTVQRWNDPPIR